FLIKESKNIFDVEFNKLSLSSLIENERLQAKIMKAEKAFNEGRYETCVALCIEFLSLVIWGDKEEGYRGIVTHAGQLSGFFGIGEEFRELMEGKYPANGEIKKLADKVGKALVQLGQVSTTTQFLTLEQKLEFIKLMSKKQFLKEDAEDALDLATNVILTWQERGVF
ncbi:MAG: hypothetical protein QME59_07625, partial [Candidatus Hydrothermarchaeota archaeon]|nr:hypothetical protein [Candidatus Hydrothermarchaeota archaeon]